jgi:hypothetical protein
LRALHNVRRSLAGYAEVQGEAFVYPKFTYRAKAKLDGTNGAIHVLEGRFAVQSRTTLLSPSHDNHGLARWASST